MIIKSCIILTPAIIEYNLNSQNKTTTVYLDYTNKEIHLTEEIENEKEFKQKLSSFIFKEKFNPVPIFSIKEMKTNNNYNI